MDLIAFILVIVGAINWGLIAIFKLNLVTAILGSVPVLVTIVYVLVGLAGVYCIYLLLNVGKK